MKVAKKVNGTSKPVTIRIFRTKKSEIDMSIKDLAKRGYILKQRGEYFYSPLIKKYYAILVKN